MIDGPTKEPTDRELLELILKRLDALEAAAEERTRDTKPLLAELHSYVANLSVETREGFANINARLQRMDRRFETLAGDMVDLRNRQSDVEARVDAAEQRPS